MTIFEVLREKVDLTRVAKRYTELNPSGDSLRGRCPHPAHEDDDPSFHVYPDGRFFCYGCRRHGDVVDVWAIANNLRPGIEAALNLAGEYGIDLPKVDPETRARAEERRLLEAACLERAGDAFEALCLYPDVIDWWERRGFGEDLRERFLLGAGGNGAEATIPFWHRGRVHGLIRRRLAGGSTKYLLPKKEEFPSGHRPLFVPGSLRGDVFLVEGYVDALALSALGMGAVAVGGTGISKEQMHELRGLPGPLYVLPDDDEEGQKAARRWAEDLYPKALLCSPRYTKETTND